MVQDTSHMSHGKSEINLIDLEYSHLTYKIQHYLIDHTYIDHSLIQLY